MRNDERPQQAYENAAPIVAFVHELLAFIDDFAAAHDPPTAKFAFGPLVVAMRVVGDTLRQRLTSAIEFARLANDSPMAPDWRIIAIDGTASEIGAPPEWDFQATSRRHFDQRHHRADQKLSVRYDPGTRAWRIVSAAQRLAVVWTADATRLWEWEDSAPCRDLFHWMTVPTECFLAHAAAIGVGGRGVLLAGPSGSGKSTMTGAAALRGLTTAGDDFVLVDPRFPRAYALYDAVKLDVHSAELLPTLAAFATNSDRAPHTKGRIHLLRSCPSAFVPQLSINAILLPRIDGGSKTMIVPVSSGVVMRALAPSTLFLIGGGEKETIRKLSAFLRSMQAYECRLGPDPMEAVDTISAFVGGLAK